MPLVRIDLAAGKSADYRRTIGEVVYHAMRERRGSIRLMHFLRSPVMTLACRSNREAGVGNHVTP